MLRRFVFALVAILAPLTADAVIIDVPLPPVAGVSIIDGKPLDLSAYRGKVVYLDIWASWCGPCVVSLPALQKMQDDLSSLGVQVVGLNTDEDVERARKLMEDAHVTYPVVRGIDAKTIARFEIIKMPAAYLIDREGVVRYSYQGFSERGFQAIRPMVEELARTGKIEKR